MYWLLEEPSSLSSKVWKDWLADLRTITPCGPEVEDEIRSAERTIARLEAYEREDAERAARETQPA